MNSRREFLRKLLLTGVSLPLLPQIMSAAARTRPSQEELMQIADSVCKIPKSRLIKLKRDSVILFQGDSITDAARNKKIMEANNPDGFGIGYMSFAAKHLLDSYPQMGLKIYNRGISGNRVDQLKKRWETDTMQLCPDVLSVLIGVNDFLTMLVSPKSRITQNSYYQDYRDILKMTKSKFPQVRFIIIEPFAISGTKSVSASWYPEFDIFREVSHRIADEFNAPLIASQSLYAEALKFYPSDVWSTDGIHAGPSASRLLAFAWLKAFDYSECY